MQRTCIILIIGLLAVCLSCAAGPQPSPAPKSDRRSTRHLNKGIELYTRGCYEQALVQFYESHERFTAADDLRGIANSLQSIANTYVHLDDPQSALLVYDDAVEAYRLVDDRIGLIRARINKAEALIAADRLPAAAAELDWADAEEANRTRLAALRYKTRALLLMRRNDLDGARKLLDKALSAQDDGQVASLAAVRYSLGELALKMKHFETASDHFRMALSLDRSAGAYFHIAQDLEALGKTHLLLDKPGVATTYFKRSAKIYALLNNTPKVQAVVKQMEQSAVRADVPIEATLYWINQWLAGKTEANLCR